MKKQIKIISLALSACLFVGCSSVTSTAESVIAKAKALVGIETEAESSVYVAPEGATQVTGLVLTAYGNEITLQLAMDSSSTSSSGGMQGSMDLPEGATEGEMPEGMTEGDMGDRTEMSGEMSEGMTEGEGGMSDRTEMSGDSTAMSEGNSAMGGDSAAMSEGNSAMGGDSAAMSEGNSVMGGDSSAMGGDSSAMGGMSEMGGMGEMSGGMSGGMDAGTTVDYSSIIILSDETQLYVIPSGTAVEYFGFEMTFSQIEAEQYITITISEEGKILYVEVLG